MVIALKLNDNGRFLSFSTRLFLSVVALFVISAVLFVAYQFQREKEFKVELLNGQLQQYNERIYERLEGVPRYSWGVVTEEYLSRHLDHGLRVTLILHSGEVIYDNGEARREMGNHLTRTEVNQALTKGSGYDIRRTSETTGKPYFYSATNYEELIIRSEFGEFRY